MEYAQKNVLESLFNRVAGLQECFHIYTLGFIFL